LDELQTPLQQQRLLAPFAEQVPSPQLADGAVPDAVQFAHTLRASQ
jgi:hypothetical protein